MAIKATDKFIITGKEVPITVDHPNGAIRYHKEGEVFEASDWPSWKKTVSDALACEIIAPATFSNIIEEELVEEVVEEEVVGEVEVVEDLGVEE